MKTVSFLITVFIFSGFVLSGQTKLDENESFREKNRSRIIMTETGILTKAELHCLYGKNVEKSKSCDKTNASGKCCNHIIPKCGKCRNKKSPKKDRSIKTIE